MHRRIPVLRRFGAMSFGLGWFEDGVWVDHATAAESADGGDGGTNVDREGPEWGAIHAWFSCCGVEVDGTDRAGDARAAPAGGAVRQLPVAASSVSS